MKYKDSNHKEQNTLFTEDIEEEEEPISKSFAYNGE